MSKNHALRRAMVAAWQAGYRNGVRDAKRAMG
jgi:hypothetical protein